MKNEQIEKVKDRVSFVERFAKDVIDTIAAHCRFAEAKGKTLEQVADAELLEYFRGKLAIMKDYVGDVLDMVEAQQALDKASQEGKGPDNQGMENEKKTVKEALDEAYNKGWEAILKPLSDSGVSFDDCDGGIYVDDPAERKTYCLNVTQIECDECGGEEEG